MPRTPPPPAKAPTEARPRCVSIVHETPVPADVVGTFLNYRRPAVNVPDTPYCWDCADRTASLDRYVIDRILT